MVRKPDEPTKAEREEHELSHQPPANWCDFCMMARSIASPHRVAHPEDRKGEVPVVAMDLCYMGQKDSDTLMPVAVVKEDSLGEVVVHGLQPTAVNSGNWTQGKARIWRNVS